MSLPSRPRILTAREYGSEPLRALARRGEAIFVRRGAYRHALVDATLWEDDRAQFLARCAAVADRLTGTWAFSHTSAAALRRWPALVLPSAVDIVQVTRPTRTRSGDIRRHYRPGLARDDVVEIDGLPVTSTTLTVLDCVRSQTPREGLVIADHALTKLARVERHDRQRSLLRQDTLRAQWQQALSELGPAPHVRRAREVLRYATGLAGSPAESRMRWNALVAGLPEPECEWEIRADGKQYFSDMSWLEDADDWPHHAITFEYDGVDKYGDTAATAVAVIAGEKIRQDAISSLGIAVHRVTKERLRNEVALRTWMLSKFPPSTLARLEHRPLLTTPPRPPRHAER